MSSIPSFELLLADINKPYRLAAPSGECFTAELCAATEGIPMNECYRCYRAEFLLRDTASLPQALYTVHAASGEEWPLLLTPIGPHRTGRARMEAVFHVQQRSLTPRSARSPCEPCASTVFLKEE